MKDLLLITIASHLISFVAGALVTYFFYNE